jgi:hypothetical protein
MQWLGTLTPFRYTLIGGEYTFAVVRSPVEPPPSSCAFTESENPDPCQRPRRLSCRITM